MSIITISRGSFSKGKEVAEKVSERLGAGYQCVSREVFLEASREFNIPEVKLHRAIHDSPSILDRFGYTKDRYITFIRAAILQNFRKDNVVYCGLAGHFFVKDIPHVLKVRIISDMNVRINSEVEAEGISEKEARHIILKDDEERRKWSEYLYGINTSDPHLYDLMIHIGKMSTDDAAYVISQTVALDRFKSTPESLQALENLAIAAQVEADLMDLAPDVDVVASNGMVQIHTAALLVEKKGFISDIEAIAKSVEGVEKVTIGVKPKDL